MLANPLERGMSDVIPGVTLFVKTLDAVLLTVGVPPRVSLGLSPVWSGPALEEFV